MESERLGNFEPYLKQTFEVRVGLSRAQLLKELEGRDDVHFGGSVPPFFRSPASEAEFLVWVQRRFVLIRRAFGGPIYVLALEERPGHLAVRGYFRGVVTAHPYGSGWGPIKWLGRRVVTQAEDQAHAKALVGFAGAVLLPHELGGPNSPFRAASAGD